MKAPAAGAAGGPKAKSASAPKAKATAKSRTATKKFFPELIKKAAKTARQEKKQKLAVLPAVPAYVEEAQTPGASAPAADAAVFTLNANTTKVTFGPEKIDYGLCMARTWAGGRGGQCTQKRADGDNDFCSMHRRDGKWEVHGRVDGPIPEAKLAEFQRHASKVAAGSSSSPSGGKGNRIPKPERLAKSLVRSLQKRGKKAKVADLDPVRQELLARKPKRPAGGAWGAFMEDKRQDIMKSLPPGYRVTDISKTGSEQWKALGEEEKQQYQKKYEEKMAVFKQAMHDFQLDALAKGVVVLDTKTPTKKRKMSDGTPVKEPQKLQKALPISFAKEIAAEFLGAPDEDAVHEASGLGYEKAFRELRCRAGIVEKKLPEEKLVRALRASGGSARKAYAALVK